MLGLTALSVFLSCSLHAQGLKDGFYLDDKLQDFQYPTHPIPFGTGGLQPKDIDTSFSVTHYDLWLDLEKPLRVQTASQKVHSIAGRVRMEIVVQQNQLDSIVLNAVAMGIRSATITRFGSDITSECLVHYNSNSEISIVRDGGFQRADALAVTLEYDILSTFYGLHVYSYYDAERALLPFPIAFTFSQPENARYWYPCLDSPHNKATYTIVVTVPKEFTVVCSGTKFAEKTINDSTIQSEWRLGVLTPTYLTSVNASIYSQDDQQATSIDGRTIPIRNYHWETDRTDTAFHAMNALKNIPKMFEALEPVFGVYPYEAYGHVTIAPVQFGGMEHMMMSSINREWLRGKAEHGYAHELAHHWSGNAVTCATWADLWLNEGGATWAEAIWRNYNEGVGGYYGQMSRRRDRYMRNPKSEPAIYNIDMSQLFNEAITYCKAAWVYHMASKSVGDSVFAASLQGYYKHYNGKSVQTKDFVEWLNSTISNPPIPWNTFFEQWLTFRGHPKYTFSYEGSLDANITAPTRTFRIEQYNISDSDNRLFTMPLRLAFKVNNVYVDTVIVMNQASLTINSALFAKCTDVIINPFQEVLCEHEIQSVALGVDDEGNKIIPLQLLSKQPTERGNDVEFGLQHDVFTLEVFSVNGVKVASINPNHTQTVHVSTNQFLAGAYVAVAYSPRGVQSIPFIVQ